MEMIDVLTRLKEIAESKPELVKDAVENVEKTNPKEVTEGGMKDYLHGEAEKMSREEFLKKHGESLRGFYNAIDGSEDDEDDMEEGKMMKKETVKEDIKISADTPQEASMMMQMLKLAGVQPVDQAMISQGEPEHGSDMDPGEMNKQMDVPGDDAMGSMQMAKMRDMVTAPDEEKAAETFANSPGDREKDEPTTMDTDTLVNTMSGGMNRQKKTHQRVSPGDNPMAAEDKITEQDLANSLRDQYDAFKESYQKAAEAKAKPDFLDMDKDGNKKEPMKKAIKDKEAK